MNSSFQKIRSVAGSVSKRWRHQAAGPELRQGVSGVRATVFGAYGFVGRYVTELLGSQGTQVIVPFRGDDMEWRLLRPMGDNGMIVPVPFNPRDEDSMRRVIDGSDVVINCIGKDYETTHFAPWLKNYRFNDVHVDVPRQIAKLSVEYGVQNLVHVSALASDKYSMSAWARSKALGEEAVRAEAPGATIVRPADVFGPEDRFLNLFAQLYELLPRVPVIDGGRARVQPIFIQDVADAIHKIALSTEPDVMLGQTYDLAGPEVYTHTEVIEYVFEKIRALNPAVMNISPAIADIIGEGIGIFPRPIINRDRFVRMQADAVLDDLAATKRLHDLDIEATSMEMPGFTFLHRYRSGTHFLDVAES